MAKEATIGEGEPIGNYGKSLHGGTPMQDASKIICLIPQRTMDVVSDKDPCTKRNYAFPRPQVVL